MQPQGQSDATLDKERKIGSLLHVGMTAVNAIAARNPYCRTYWHLDLNAGSGWNEQADCPGSPVVACELARRLLGRVTFRALFCDIDAGRIADLRGRLNGTASGETQIVCADNRDVIARFAEWIKLHESRPHYAMGSILVDPNAWFNRSREGMGVPVAELIAFCRAFPRIDPILNLNSFFYWRAHGLPWGAELPSPEQIRVMLGRKHWLVGRNWAGSARFWLTIGRNFETGAHHRMGLYDWDSDAGRRIVDQAANRPVTPLLQMELPRQRKRGGARA